MKIFDEYRLRFLGLNVILSRGQMIVQFQTRTFQTPNEVIDHIVSSSLFTVIYNYYSSGIFILKFGKIINLSHCLLFVMICMANAHHLSGCSQYCRNSM
jgi:hypothetical protein